MVLIGSRGTTAAIETPRLPVEKWSRVSIPTAKVPPPHWGFVRIVGDPSSPEFSRGNKVSFEFNRFHMLSNSHASFGESGLVSHRATPRPSPGNEGKSLDIVLLAKPGKFFEYRHAFDRPEEVLGVSELSGRSAVEIGGRTMYLRPVHKRECHVLWIGLEAARAAPKAAEVAAALGMTAAPFEDDDEFPPVSAAALEVLTPEERGRVEKEGLEPFVFRVGMGR